MQTVRSLRSVRSLHLSVPRIVRFRNLGLTLLEHNNGDGPRCRNLRRFIEMCSKFPHKNLGNADHHHKHDLDLEQYRAVVVRIWGWTMISVGLEPGQASEMKPRLHKG